ncbi:Undecaprenyl-diphosphatase BcrC [compost metagenome]
MHALASPGLNSFFVLMSKLGYQWGVIPIDVLIVGILLFMRRWRKAAFAATAFVGSALLNLGSKQIFQRERPSLWESVAPESTFSFPSGHAMGSMTLALTVVLLLWNTRWRWPALCAAITFTGLVGLARVYLGVHYPSDILGGWCAALVWVLGVYMVMFRRRWSLPAP